MRGKRYWCHEGRLDDAQSIDVIQKVSYKGCQAQIVCNFEDAHSLWVNHPKSLSCGHVEQILARQLHASVSEDRADSKLRVTSMPVSWRDGLVC